MVKSIAHRCPALSFTRPIFGPLRSPEVFEQFEPSQDILPSSSGLQTQSQIGDPQQIVRPGHEIGPSLRPLHSAIAGAPQATHRFHPTKDFFHPFAQPLAGPVTGTTGRASIQSRNFPSHFARRVRRDFPFPAPGHKFLLVIPFTRPASSYTSSMLAGSASLIRLQFTARILIQAAFGTGFYYHQRPLSGLLTFCNAGTHGTSTVAPRMCSRRESNLSDRQPFLFFGSFGITLSAPWPKACKCVA